MAIRGGQLSVLARGGVRSMTTTAAAITSYSLACRGRCSGQEDSCDAEIARAAGGLAQQPCCSTESPCGLKRGLSKCPSWCCLRGIGGQRMNLALQVPVCFRLVFGRAHEAPDDRTNSYYEVCLLAAVTVILRGAGVRTCAKFKHPRGEGMQASAVHRATILKGYRQLLSLIHRLEEPQRSAALQEAREKFRGRRSEAHPEKLLQYSKELAARLSYLRATTVKTQPEAATPGPLRFVWREGKLVEGQGATQGSRCVVRVRRSLPCCCVALLPPRCSSRALACSPRCAACYHDGSGGTESSTRFHHRRAADGTMSKEEAFARNARDYKRLHGHAKPASLVY